MKIKTLASVLAVATLTSACGMMMKVPMTTEELRQGVLEGNGKPTEVYSVSKPFNDVSKNLSDKANQCLSVKIKSTTTMSNGGEIIKYITYKPSVNVKKNYVEIALQVKEEGAFTLVKPDMPNDGMFIVLADIKSSGKSNTNLDLYYAKMGIFNPYEKIVTALKGWADGSIRGCPDLANG
ncbi:MAG: hypothetical protein OEW58_09705 [Gammaproteobacteria bacterium]|nr:hypothetical protein [Gammaproteobacteria bacterium]